MKIIKSQIQVVPKFRMSKTLHVPWHLDRQIEQTIIRAEVIKSILQNICQRHRYYNLQWQYQRTSQHLEIENLVEVMIQNGIYTTNREEQITTGLHCLFLWIMHDTISYDKCLKINQIGPQIVSQLETKAGNRYFHDIKIYRMKNLIKRRVQQGNIHTRGYIIEKQAIKLDYTYTGSPTTMDTMAFNFPEIQHGK